jgi:anti-sigma factor RsiW
VIEMLACLKYRKRLGAFLDNELSGREQSLVERHMARCVSCRAALENWQKLAPLLASCQAPPVPPALAARIQAAAKTIQKTKARGLFGLWLWETWTMQPWMLKGAIAAALVIGLTMGGYMGWSGSRIDRLARSAATIYEAEAVDGPLYAFQTLDAAPQGSMVAAALALTEYDRRGKR